MSLLLMLIIGVLVIRNSNTIIFKLDKIKIEPSKLVIEIWYYIIFVIYLLYINSFYTISSVVSYSLIYLILFLVMKIDKNEGIIPDKYNIAILLIGILNTIINKVTIKEVLISVFPIILLLIAILVIEKITDSEIMGGGDIKLLFVIAVTVGLENTLALLFLSNLFFIFRNNKGDGFVAFAPYIYRGYIVMSLLVNVYSYLIYF